MSLHDEALSTRIKNALANDKRISGLPIDVRVSGDEVFLKGRVKSPEQADTVQFIVIGIPGVRHINTDELEFEESNQ